MRRNFHELICTEFKKITIGYNEEGHNNIIVKYIRLDLSRNLEPLNISVRRKCRIQVIQQSK